MKRTFIIIYLNRAGPDAAAAGVPSRCDPTLLPTRLFLHISEIQYYKKSPTGAHTGGGKGKQVADQHIRPAEEERESHQHIPDSGSYSLLWHVDRSGGDLDTDAV